MNKLIFQSFKFLNIFKVKVVFVVDRLKNPVMFVSLNVHVQNLSFVKVEF